MVLKQTNLADFGARWINIVADEQEVVFGTINEELQSTDVTWTKPRHGQSSKRICQT